MKKLLSLIIAAGVLSGIASVSFADPTTQVDSLLQKLVEKKILSQDEADQVKGEIAYDEKTLRATNVKSDIPEWVQNLKLKGDFRIRHQWEQRNSGTELDRNRGRLRYRLGLETNVNDKVAVGVGIATNGGNGTSNTGGALTDFGPRSNNASFQNTFSKQAPVINYAYAQYKLNSQLTLTGGKMLNPIWEPWEFLWDGDITPEGGAVQYERKINDLATVWGMVTAFQIDEISGNQADPFMYVAQGGLKGKLTEKTDYKLAGSWYGTDNITKTLLDNNSGTNTTNPQVSSQYAYHYNTAVVAMDVGVNDPFGEMLPIFIPRIGIFGEYANNPDAPDKNVAWMAGGYIGNSSINGWKTWKLTAAKKVIGKDAFLDVFPDSDFYGGATDSKGYEGMLEIGLAKNVSLAVDYYRSERIKTTKAQESVLQTDLNFKF